MRDVDAVRRTTRADEVKRGWDECGRGFDGDGSRAVRIRWYGWCGTCVGCTRGREGAWRSDKRRLGQLRGSCLQRPPYPSLAHRRDRCITSHDSSRHTDSCTRCAHEVSTPALVFFSSSADGVVPSVPATWCAGLRLQREDIAACARRQKEDPHRVEPVLTASSSHRASERQFTSRAYLLHLGTSVFVPPIMLCASPRTILALPRTESTDI